MIYMFCIYGQPKLKAPNATFYDHLDCNSFSNVSNILDESSFQEAKCMSEACNVVVVTHDSGVSFVCHNRPQDMPSVLRRCPRFVEAGDAAPATAAIAEQARNADNSPRAWGITVAATPGIHLELCSLQDNKNN